ncbi:PP2C family protein-serine/threonine phosphatase [Catenuloplanes atrovinosus]|uniref:Serine/threonine protein phosphatase PrpC n=1 Tax=Catenuloplanes atrovinosus TaxID=137266 RepID=A0AAE3YNQ7_9ACTN|nr:protein phosphatase 2C domain-containing protein [Catenuloplanes atrovinosus]MDR7275867.1 serine/threonine protein phosphatase PrpC [Catenuloplanes atrovinosus]
MSAAPACPDHGPADDDASFCEVCGRNLRTGALPRPRLRPAATRPSPHPRAGTAAATRNEAGAGTSAATRTLATVGNDAGAARPAGTRLEAGPGNEARIAAEGGAGRGGPGGEGPGRSSRRDGGSGSDVPPAMPRDAGEGDGYAWLSARETGGVCAGCGAAAPAARGWCEECGRRVSAARDRAALTLDGVAAVTDRARRRHNEDAVAVGHAGGAVAAVVCDGISSARRADAAATDAAEAGVSALLEAVAGGAGGRAATAHAGVVAAEAAAATGRAEDGDAPPGCTYVSVVVAADGVTVGWVGDSRAYWVGADGDARQLTVDDSIAAIREAGRPVPDGLADADPDSRALVRWLGADAGEVAPQVRSFAPGRPGHVVACTDGLSRYLPSAADLAAAMRSGASPAELALELTALALDAGGDDNIAVAVLPVAVAEARRT